MLDPESRQVLLDALRPPEGHDVSFAIGTTYSLDLLALLTAPLGFTQFELAGTPGSDLGYLDTLRLLSVLRRYSERVAVFAEAGRTAVPRRHSMLFQQLEQSVVHVRPPTGFSFHPKVWVVRFADAQDPSSVQYRLICLTRNLTFDCSWDTVLVLDGVLMDRRRGFSGNRPLADFFGALPGMAVWDVPVPIAEFVRTAAHELTRVEWELPDPFDHVEFWPLGVDGHRHAWPFDDSDRTLIMAPFLSDGFLKRVGQAGTGHVLVSRLDTLETVPASTLKPFKSRHYAFSADVVADAASAEETAGVEPLGSAGLHAKLFLMEHGWDASLFTGSANATHAAWNGNVEFLVRLIGKKSRVGIDVLLAEERGQAKFREFLVEFRPLPSPREDDPVAVSHQKKLENARRVIAGCEWVARIESIEGGGFRVTLTSDAELPTDVVVFCRPVLLPESAALPLSNATLTFDGLSFEGLTAFYAFDVRLADGSAHDACTFLVNARLENAPAGRQERLTQYLLANREHVVRFLLMLLSTSGGVIGGEREGGADDVMKAEKTMRARGSSDALLEPMLRALHREPGRLDQVRSVLEDLAKTAEGRAKLPAGIDEVWGAVWHVREEIRGAEEGV